MAMKLRKLLEGLKSEIIGFCLYYGRFCEQTLERKNMSWTLGMQIAYFPIKNRNDTVNNRR
jgi:hypothetical protein